MKFTVFIILTLIITLTACNNPEPPASEAPSASTPTEVSLLSQSTEPTSEHTEEATSESDQTPTPTLAATFTPTLTPKPSATNTRVPTTTPTPKPSPRPTSTPEPAIRVDETLTTNINIRSGPSTNYPVLTQFEPGQEALVLGRLEDSSWWQIDLPTVEGEEKVGWVYAALVDFTGNEKDIVLADPPPEPESVAVAAEENSGNQEESSEDAETPVTAEELEGQLRCGKDFCVTYQAMLPIWENGGCVGNHSIYITVLEGPPPGKPLDGVVIGDTYNNVEVGSGSHGPGRTEITLWSNSMTLVAKRSMADDAPYTSEESFNFTSHDELIPAEVLAASGYCEGRIDVCEHARNHNGVCRGHYSWRVTFHKFD